MAVNNFFLQFGFLRFVVCTNKIFRHYSKCATTVNYRSPNLPCFPSSVIGLCVFKPRNKSSCRTNQRNRNPRNGKPSPTEKIKQSCRNNTQQEHCKNVLSCPRDKMQYFVMCRCIHL